MKKLITVLVATLALALIAFTPDVASAGKGWKGGGHWHGGRHWRGHGWRGHRGWRGPRYAYRGWGYRRAGWGWGGWGGWWGPGIAIAIGPGFYGRRCWSPSYGYYPCRYRWGY
jgi:uncharacterized membrane protein